MSGVRRAAMLLHALGDGDRDWLLARLPATQAGELRGLLGELRELGLPADRELIEQAVGEAPPAPASQSSRSAACIAAADAARILALLRGEPDRLVALVTSSSAWPWREPFFGQLGPQRAARLREMSLAMRAPVSLRAAVLDALAQRVRQAEADDPRPVAQRRPGRWSLPGLRHRLSQGVAAWRR